MLDENKPLKILEIDPRNQEETFGKYSGNFKRIEHSVKLMASVSKLSHSVQTMCLAILTCCRFELLPVSVQFCAHRPQHRPSIKVIVWLRCACAIFLLQLWCYASVINQRLPRVESRGVNL